MTTGLKTLADWAKETDPNGNALTVVQYVDQVNQLDDIPAEPSNSDTTMIGVRTVGLPAITRRKINQGVDYTKSEKQNFNEVVVNYTALGGVDKQLIDIAKDKAMVRLNENIPFFQAMGEAFADDLFNGKLSTGAFDGFGERYNSLSNKQVVGFGGSANRASIYFVGWSKHTVTTFFPRNSKAGVQHTDMGLKMIETADGKRMPGYEDLFEQMRGLAIKNPKYVSRICNINVQNINYADLFRAMIKAKNKIPTLNGVAGRIYCNEDIYTALETAAFEKANAILTYKEIQGSTPVVSFGNMVIKRIDALGSNETAVA